MGDTITLAPAAAEETLYLPAGWEVKTATAEAADAPAIGGALLEADEKTGRVVAIVGITGVVDHVNDLIEAGAYAKTLKKRRPKVCWAHDWEKPVGRVPAIEEWPPGDPRFAEVGATLDGKAWPADAGALVASMQFNMKSERGREAFAAVEFYSETGECEWSIGWQTVPGKTIKRKSDGVRVCTEVELFEVSPVLFGAAPHTRTLQVKSIRLDEAVVGAYLAKVGQAAGDVPGAAGTGDDTTDEAALHRAAMDEIDWAEVDAATSGEAPDSPAGTPAEGKGVVLDLGALGVDLDSPMGLDFSAMAAQLVTDVKAGEGGADRNKGGAEELRRWYEEGEGAAKIAWGTPGDFMRCVGIAGKHMTTERAKGYCNLRHKGATGVYAGQEKTLGVQAAETLAKTWNPLLEVGKHAGHKAPEAKWYGELSGDGLDGSFEQRRSALSDALTTHLREVNDWSEPTRERDRYVEKPWVSIEGTWPDRVICTYIDYSGETTRRQTYEVAYSWDDGDVELGETREVEIRPVVVPKNGGPRLRTDDVLPIPAMAAIDEGTLALKSALHVDVEGKAGRVLSEANVTRLRGALEHLLAVARAAGVQVGEEQTAKPQADGTPDTTAPDTSGPGTPANVAVKVLDRAELEAQLAELEKFSV